MRSPWVIGLLILLCAGAAWYFVGGGGAKEDSDLVSDLKKRQRRAETTKPVVDETPKFEPLKEAAWRDLEKTGKGVPVPEHLFVNPSDSGQSWVVTNPGQELNFAVEIPFGAGRYPTPPPKDQTSLKENPGFLGSDSCENCHKEKYDSFVHTAHYLTSRWAGKDAITGSFEAGKDVLNTRSPYVAFKMVERDGRFFQRVYFFGWEFEVPMDIVIGSSKLGQSYLFWHGDELYQNNVTYVTMRDRWINSPGYLDGDAQFARPIHGRCVDCHFTYIDFRERPNHYTHSSIIMGISCERCHGPGQEHVAFHQENKDVKEGKHISTPTKLSRAQQLDLCGQCHSTVTDMKHGKPFAFRPGDRFEDHYQDPDPEKEGNSVHTSNQISRLAKSECFQKSEMACADCHNPHKVERGEMALFSKRCLQCHENTDCGMHEQKVDGLVLEDNCVDCHMAKRETENMRMNLAGENVFPPLRDHFIHVDQQATQEFLFRLEANKRAEP